MAPDAAGAQGDRTTLRAYSELPAAFAVAGAAEFDSEADGRDSECLAEGFAACAEFDASSPTSRLP